MEVLPEVADDDQVARMRLHRLRMGLSIDLGRSLMKEHPDPNIKFDEACDVILDVRNALTAAKDAFAYDIDDSPLLAA